MNKTQKKLDKNLIKALTQACESCKGFAHGFEWLTHTVNYKNFPASLQITCVFDSEDAKQHATNKRLTTKMVKVIEEELAIFEVRLKKIEQHIHFDSEQACYREHGGNWQQRLSVH